MQMVSKSVVVSNEEPCDSDIESADLQRDVTNTLLQGENNVEDLIKSQPVVMISKSTCPFCFELKRTLQTYGVSYDVAEINLLPGMQSIQKDLKAKHGICSVPLLFLNGELVGGCTYVKELEHSGEFQRLISPFVTSNVPKEERVARFAFLYFPETVNKLVVRVVGLLSMLYCILCVVFYDRSGTKYAVLGLAVDFVIRVVFGSGGSPIGMVGAAIVAPFDPIFSAGAPKQFAACCGTFMSVLAAALLLAGEQLAGTVVIGMLVMPTGLEGIFDFCLVSKSNVMV
jgi:glutaredoxin 3